MLRFFSSTFPQERGKEEKGKKVFVRFLGNGKEGEEKAGIGLVREDACVGKGRKTSVCLKRASFVRRIGIDANLERGEGEDPNYHAAAACLTISRVPSSPPPSLLNVMGISSPSLGNPS